MTGRRNGYGEPFKTARIRVGAAQGETMSMITQSIDTCYKSSGSPYKVAGRITSNPSVLIPFAYADGNRAG